VGWFKPNCHGCGVTSYSKAEDKILQQLGYYRARSLLFTYNIMPNLAHVSAPAPDLVFVYQFLFGFGSVAQAPGSIWLNNGLGTGRNTSFVKRLQQWRDSRFAVSFTWGCTKMESGPL